MDALAVEEEKRAKPVGLLQIAVGRAGTRWWSVKIVEAEAAEGEVAMTTTAGVTAAEATPENGAATEEAPVAPAEAVSIPSAWTSWIQQLWPTVEPSVSIPFSGKQNVSELD